MKHSELEVLKTTGVVRNPTRWAWTPRVFVLAALALALATLGGGCSRDPGAFSSKKYRLPWPDGSGQYKLQDVEIQTMSDPTHFRGDVAQILVEPSDGGGHLTGEQPVGRYIRSSSGTIVPADFVTLEAATVYAHLERLRALDIAVGSSPSIHWPLMIGVQTNVLDGGDAITNNAVYDGRLDALLIVPYSGSGVPIAMNAGILAHEHFHTIFQSLVLSKINEKGVTVSKPTKDILAAAGCSWAANQRSSGARTNGQRVRGNGSGEVMVDVTDSAAVTEAADQIPKATYNSFLIRSLNEGLADFWGWVYSGDATFIAPSLPTEGRVRRMDSDSGQLPTEQTIRRNLVDLSREDKLLPERDRVTLAYRLGTQYARFMRETAIEMAGTKADTSTLESRQVVARALLLALPDIGASVAAAYTESYLSPNFIIKPLTLQMGALSSASCTRILRFKAVTQDKASDVPASCLAQLPKDSREGEDAGVGVSLGENASGALARGTGSGSAAGSASGAIPAGVSEPAPSASASKSVVKSVVKPAASGAASALEPSASSPVAAPVPFNRGSAGGEE